MYWLRYNDFWSLLGRTASTFTILRHAPSSTPRYRLHTRALNHLPARPPESWLVSSIASLLSVLFLAKKRLPSSRLCARDSHRKERRTDIYHHCIDSSTSDTQPAGSPCTCRPAEVPRPRKPSPASACRLRESSYTTSPDPTLSSSDSISLESLEQHILFVRGTWSRTAGGRTCQFSARGTGGSLRYTC